VVLMFAGCGTPLKERFYTLSSSAAPERTASRPSYRITVGPVTIPALVDRPQIVLRAGANRVTLAEESRWAEPLKDSIPRVVAGNLASLLEGARVSAYTQGAGAAADYRVLLDIQRFESVMGDAATLEVLWTIGRASGGIMTAGRSLIREPVGGADTDALVAAHERALAAVSRDIAAAIGKLAEPLPLTGSLPNAPSPALAPGAGSARY
jgi:uncharacterized lipoprotein YmbA